MNKYYDFSSKVVDGQSLVHIINLMLGKDLVGAEVGVFKAQTLCTLLQNCPNIKKVYAVDSYKPYSDYLSDLNEVVPDYSISQPEIEFIREIAHHNVKWSGHKDKVFFIEDDSRNAVKTMGPLDFVFLDTCMTYQQQVNDMEDWFPTVKTGGLFSGHDWEAPAVKLAVMEFRKKYNITASMSVFDNTWMWIK